MKIYKTRALAGAASLLLLSASSPRAESGAGSADQVFRYGAGARDIAMGQAMIVSAQGASALYWNPSLLAEAGHREVQLFRSQLFEGFNYSYLGYVHPFRDAAGMAVQLLSYGVSDGETRDANNAAAGSFSDRQTALGLGAGVKGIVLPDLNLGVSLNVLNRSLAGRSSSLFGADVGVTHSFLHERLDLGLTVKNPLAFSSGPTDDELPLRVQLGAGYEVLRGFRIAADASDTGEFGAGVEYALGRHLALAAGRAPDGSLSFGSGFLYKNARVDFAYTPDPHAGLGSSLATSMGLRWGTDRSAGRIRTGAALLARAQESVKRGDWTAATRTFNRVISLDPANLQAREGAARLARLMEPLGVRRARDEQRLKEKSAWPLLRQSVNASLEGSDRQAQLFAGYASLKDPGDPKIRELLNFYEMHSSVRVLSKEEQDMSPEAFIETKRKRVEAKFYGKEYGVALLECREILSLEPQNADDWERLGSIYFVIGNKEKALEAYQTAIKLNPSKQSLQQFLQNQISYQEFLDNNSSGFNSEDKE
jgi:tetratricopeptide (TPR) repeat protein